ncbi:xylose isomerase [Clostridium carboxidivorans P7]|uniref:Xylose isomerase n=1 Tax=Clostridium carboxidivorans P7 TaxID=536227 RepID=C6PVJ2_9CLOT|nr:xylose isomerase [Clostridium carboxidivorans]AKN34087.1 xylose isomerase [Clostridium carboxidivorans P7]EET86757.1 xylose isomerase [Clostridium carboxidivorans P7]EFG89380.1 xylose isomerase [Clostridium carboxidivorans P7]
MKEYFSNVSKINYEGSDSKNPYSFKYYNPDEIVGGKRMKDHLRFSMSYWHTLTANGTDQFGVGTMIRSWDNVNDKMELAKARMEAAFEFMDKLDIDYFCFHDRDIAPEGKDLVETNKNLDEMVSICKELMKKNNKKLLWGTANLFNNPRFVHGAGTTCNANVYAYSAAQLKKAIEVTNELGGENYVFWGGREGYETLLNTDIGFEMDNFARILQMAVDYAKKIGFKGQFLIEPKPKEPTKHQYDFDVATVLGFLRKYKLENYFKVNIEANHATLAGHTFQHEICLARNNNVLGSLDANQGDPHLGWDTDQFPTNIYDATLAMYEILKNGGIAPGGLNFDAKVRRASFEPEDLFLSYIAGMDTFAKGLRIAYKLLQDGPIENFIKERYSSFSTGIGKDIVDGKVGFEELEKYALSNNVMNNKSGRQEYLESIVNQYIFEDK